MLFRRSFYGTSARPPLSRRAIVVALSEEKLNAFDRGEIDSLLVDRIDTAFDAVNLIVLTVGQPAVIDKASIKTLPRQNVVLGIACLMQDAFAPCDSS